MYYAVCLLYYYQHQPLTSALYCETEAEARNLAKTMRDAAMPMLVRVDIWSDAGIMLYSWYRGDDGVWQLYMPREV